MNQAQIAVDYILDRLPEFPQSCVILGSGLGYFCNKLQCPIKISYAEIPHYPLSSIKGHSGDWIFGYINEKPIICASGRFHYYEGFTEEEILLSVTIANSLGCKLLVITNSAGCLNKEWNLGDFMLITGYLDYTFSNNSDPPEIILFESNTINYKKVKYAALDLDILLKEGIYTWTLGPSFETPAEIQDIISLGGHAVGMSTVPEIMKAKEIGLEIIGISCFTNYGAGMQVGILSHEDVLINSNRIHKRFSSFIQEII